MQHKVLPFEPFANQGRGQKRPKPRCQSALPMRLAPNLGEMPCWQHHRSRPAQAPRPEAGVPAKPGDSHEQEQPQPMQRGTEA